MSPNVVECPLQTKISPGRTPLDESNNTDYDFPDGAVDKNLPMQGT